MSTINDAALYNITSDAPRFLLHSPLAASVGTQAAATPINGRMNRILSGAAGTLKLPAILDGSAFGIVWIINDSANTVTVYCAPGEKLNGSLNGTLAIPTGQTGIFVPAKNATGEGPDWRAAAIS